MARTFPEAEATSTRAPATGCEEAAPVTVPAIAAPGVSATSMPFVTCPVEAATALTPVVGGGEPRPSQAAPA